MTVEGLLAIASGIVPTSCKPVRRSGTDQSSNYTVVYYKQREDEWSEQRSLFSKREGQNLN